MKYKEFHKIITRQGWVKVRSSGSHFVYEKNGKRYVVPFHGSGEIPEGLKIKIEKEMGL